MKVAGIIGGIGPESTIEYYRLIIAAWRERRNDGSYPAVIINSIDLTRVLSLIGANALADVTAYLVEEVKRLGRAGADFAALSAVHHGIPLLDTTRIHVNRIVDELVRNPSV